MRNPYDLAAVDIMLGDLEMDAEEVEALLVEEGYTEEAAAELVARSLEDLEHA